MTTAVVVCLVLVVARVGLAIVSTSQSAQLSASVDCRRSA